LAIYGWILPFGQTPPIAFVTGSLLASASWGYECTQGHCLPGGESCFIFHSATGVFARNRFKPRVPYRSLVSFLSDCEKEIAAFAIAAFCPFVSPDYSKFSKPSDWLK